MEKIFKSGGYLGGSINAISSKSHIHRLLICAALSDKKVKIKYNSSLSEDISATAACLENMGAEIKTDENYITVEKNIDINSLSGRLSKNTIFCSQSGSTARFLLPLAAAFAEKGAVIDGNGRLPERPFSPICQCLEEHGAVFSSHRMPIGIIKPPKSGGVFKISGDISSQFISGLMLLLPFLKDSSIMLTTKLESKGYADMTAEAMKSFGVNINSENGIYTSSGTYTTLSDVINAEGDWSNAAFWLCGAGKAESVKLSGLNRYSKQPDREIVNILKSCGYSVTEGEDSVEVRRTENALPFDVDASNIPDLVPILSVLAASIKGKSVIRNVARLKYKESDRIESTLCMIRSLGGCAESDGESITVIGTGKLRGGKVDGFGDHRIVMSSAIASLICENNVSIDGFEASKKSYPDFLEDYKILKK